MPARLADHALAAAGLRGLRVRSQGEAVQKDFAKIPPPSRSNEVEFEWRPKSKWRGKTHPSPMLCFFLAEERGTSVAAARSSLRLDDDDGDVYGCDVLTECDLDIAVVYRHSLLFAHVYERGATVGGARSR